MGAGKQEGVGKMQVFQVAFLNSVLVLTLRPPVCAMGTSPLRALASQPAERLLSPPHLLGMLRG